MLRIAFLSLSLLTSFAQAKTELDATCASHLYQGYVDASVAWYKSLVSIAVEAQPELQDVGDWFLEARQAHFQFHGEAFDYFLAQSPERLNFSQSVESWLKLSQHEVKEISESQLPIASKAQSIYQFRQQKNHEKNYALRDAFAQLLSQPQVIQQPLKNYNLAMSELTPASCERVASR